MLQHSPTKLPQTMTATKTRPANSQRDERPEYVSFEKSIRRESTRSLEQQTAVKVNGYVISYTISQRSPCTAAVVHGWEKADASSCGCAAAQVFILQTASGAPCHGDAACRVAYRCVRQVVFLATGFPAEINTTKPLSPSRIRNRAHAAAEAHEPAGRRTIRSASKQ